MKKHITLALSLCFTLLLSACNTWYEYSYELVNETDGTLEVDYRSTDEERTIVGIAPGETSILIIMNRGNEGPDGPFFQDVNVYLQEFTVRKNDTLVSTRNYLDNAAWDYNDGVYTTTVTEAEFQ